MAYILKNKASFCGRGFRVVRGQEITDAQWAMLDARRKEFFEKKAEKKAKRDNLQPLPVEPITEPPVPVE